MPSFGKEFVMLVLSRREAEKVLFPTLGITVEVTRVQGKTVRLGIDAPNEIRIVRGELPHFESQPHSSFKSKKTLEPVENPVHIQRCLDAANLAIHLAMNQLNQQRSDQAARAMEDALECLQELEQAVFRHSHNQPWEPETAAVRESNTKYRVTAKPTVPTAAIIAIKDELRLQLVSLLNENGFRVVEFSEEHSLVKYLQVFEQPTVVLAIDSTAKEVASVGDAIQNADQDLQLRISGISGLSRNRISFCFDNQVSNEDSLPTRFTGWFDDSEIAAEFKSMLHCA